MMKNTPVWICSTLLAVTLGLSGCSLPIGNGSGGNPAPASAGLYVGVTSVTVTGNDVLPNTDRYPDLTLVDARSSSVPLEELTAWSREHPEVELLYSVPLGSTLLDSTATEINDGEGPLDYGELTAALAYLPNVTTVNLLQSQFTNEQLDALRSRCTVNAAVYFLGELLDMSTETMDLSSLTPDEVPEAVEKLPALVELKEVELMAANGSSLLSMADVSALIAAVPQARFHYSFSLFGKTVSTTDTTIEFVRQPIGDEGAGELLAALSVVYPGAYVKLDDCGFSDVVLASIRDANPGKTVVWRIHCGTTYSALTDDEVILMTSDVNDTNCTPLQYCTEVRYLDLSNNTSLHDISWIANMTKLECALLSAAPVSDLSCFASCPNLEWLELCNCYYITDLSPLRDLQNLRWLNVSFSTVDNLTPLDHVPLERFIDMGTRADEEMQQHFIGWHPDCITRFEASWPFGYGWRYNDEGVTLFEYYAKLRQVFRYADSWYGGWKLSDVDLSGFE